MPEWNVEKIKTFDKGIFLIKYELLNVGLDSPAGTGSRVKIGIIR
jgi:hypothetical protein